MYNTRLRLNCLQHFCGTFAAVLHRRGNPKIAVLETHGQLPRRTLDDARDAANIDAHRRGIAEAIDAERRFLDGGGAEPEWPALAPWHSRRRGAFASVRRAPRTKVRRRPTPPEMYVDEHRLATLANYLVGLMIGGVPAWIGALCAHLMEWTIEANNGPPGDDEYEVILDPSVSSLAVVVKYPAADLAAPLAEFQPKRRVEVNSPASGSSAIGVALVGAGNLARWAHLPSLERRRAFGCAQSIPPAEHEARAMHCVSERSTAQATITKFSNDPEIQAVVIVSRNQQHASQALAALHAGKHVFVEKPMALSQEECRELHQAAEETGKQLTVGFNRRFAPTYLALKDQVAKRNGPAVLNCRVNSPGISGSYWMADPAAGGAILGEACHFVDLMYWLLDSEPVEVSAYSLPTGKKDPIGENNLVASFRFADGSIANLTYCTVGSHTSAGERVEAFATGFGASAEDFKRSSTRTKVVLKNSSWFAEKGYEAQMRAFFAAQKQGRPPDVTVRDGVRSTLRCLLMMQSARDHAPCSIDLEDFLAPSPR